MRIFSPASPLHYRVVIGAVVLLCGSSLPQPNALAQSKPTQFEIARHTFFDFGPPNDYYELFIVRPMANGTSIERITLTPPTDECVNPAKVEFASASISDSVSDLFGSTNPCKIPGKELRRELKRCKHCMVFSGANVVMQIQCGTKARLIRSDILDKDWFDPHANTPVQTSWTMQLLEYLEHAVGPGVMDKPMFQTSENEEQPAKNPDSPALKELSVGNYDALFQRAPDKPSDLYHAAQVLPPSPSVRLLSSVPYAPEAFVEPQYPMITRMARIQGEVVFKIHVDASGASSKPIFQNGPPLLRGAVERAVSGWKFPKEAFGQEIQASIEFKLNCPKHTE